QCRDFKRRRVSGCGDHVFVIAGQNVLAVARMLQPTGAATIVSASALVSAEAVHWNISHMRGCDTVFDAGDVPELDYFFHSVNNSNFFAVWRQRDAVRASRESASRASEVLGVEDRPSWFGDRGDLEAVESGRRREGNAVIAVYRVRTHAADHWTDRFLELF